MILVNSAGGCGTTMLIEQISKAGGALVFDGHNNPCKKYKHISKPPPTKIPEIPSGSTIKKGLYVFSEPISAIKTFYRRREFGNKGEGMIKNWVAGHCRNMGGDFFLLNPKWDIDDYAKNGKDILGLNDHWFNWHHSKIEYDVMFVKYETMWYHIEKIRNFLDLPMDFVNNFPPRRERKDFPISSETLGNLTDMYGELAAELSQQPEVKIRSKSDRCRL